MRRRVIAITGFAGLLAFIWCGYGWLVTPGTYRVTVLYATVALTAAAFHVTALRRFHAMVRAIRASAVSEPLDVVFAANQRFRYTVRVIESAWVLGLAVLIAVSVHHPALATHKTFGAYVLAYFVGSIALTGYLTYRDLVVVELAREHARAVELRPFVEEHP